MIDSSSGSQKIKSTSSEVELEKEEKEALQWCKNSDKYALDLYAYEMRQGLANLKLREGIHMASEDINDQCHKCETTVRPLAFHGATIFGSGRPISIHVLDSVRCWKVKYLGT